MKNKKYDLEDRLIDFGVEMISISEMYDTKREAGRYLSKQLIRSGTSPGIHYGEAQAAESRRDFIHKIKVILKELKESRRNLKMSDRAALHSSPERMEKAISESDELIAIFVKSVQTAEKKDQRKQMNG
jgi:four helix bundle protein